MQMNSSEYNNYKKKDKTNDIISVWDNNSNRNRVVPQTAKNIRIEGGDDMKHLKITIQERKNLNIFTLAKYNSKTYREER